MEQGTGTRELKSEKQLNFKRGIIVPVVRSEIAKPEKKEAKEWKMTARDAELIEFCAQMKFSSLPTLYDRFFGKTLAGKPSKSDWYAKERISFLVNLGMLVSNESILTRSRYYSATQKGYQTAQKVMPFRELTKPIQGFDLGTFVHDREVGLIREELESKGEIVSWLSDRRLRNG